MQFHLNETQRLLQDGVRRFVAAEFDSGKSRAIEASDDGFSSEVWSQLNELGWSSVAVPEAAGGGGLGMLELCVLAEEMGRAAASTPLLVSSGMATSCLKSLPAHPLATRLLKALAETDDVITLALIDESGRDERTKPKLKLRADDNGSRLSGIKQLVPYASVAKVLLVSTSTQDGETAPETAIIAIDRDSPGISMRRNQTLGADPLFEVRFEDVAVAKDRVLARGAAAASALDASLGVATVIAIAEAVGYCEGIMGLAVEHAKVREQFGQPIGAFQAVSHPLADMRIQTDAVRLLTLEAAWLLDQGRPAELEIASAKVLANDAVEKITVDGHRVHGAIGYSKEHDVQLYTRRARAFSVTWGDTEREIERAAVALGL